MMLSWTGQSATRHHQCLRGQRESIISTTSSTSTVFHPYIHRQRSYCVKNTLLGTLTVTRDKTITHPSSLIVERSSRTDHDDPLSRQPHPARSNDDTTENTDADRNIIMNIHINISTDTLFYFALPRKGKYLLDSTMARYQVSDASSLTIVTVTTKSQSPIMIKTRLCYILMVDHRECRRIQRRTLSSSCSSHMNNSTVTMWAVIRM